jgi:hypothetical protein
LEKEARLPYAILAFNITPELFLTKISENILGNDLLNTRK